MHIGRRSSERAAAAEVRCSMYLLGILLWIVIVVWCGSGGGKHCVIQRVAKGTVEVPQQVSKSLFLWLRDLLDYYYSSLIREKE